MSRSPSPDPSMLPHKVLLLGLEAAGKTTILKQVAGYADPIIPTHGFNVGTPVFNDKEFVIWDIGGSDIIRALWPFYYDKVKGLIFVVDASDRELLDKAVEILRGLLGRDELKDIPLLLVANKQDLPNVMGDTVIVEKIGLEALRGRRLFVQKATATTGEGLLDGDGFNWLYSAIMSDAAYYSDYDRLIAIKSVFYSSSITETTDTCLDRLFQICLYSNENIVELCRDKYFIARLIRIVQEPLMSEDVGVIGAKSKALVLTRLFLQMRHSLSNEVKKEFALNSDAILNCLSISKKAIENEEERNYQVIQFYRTVIQILDMLTVNKELQQLTLFHDETIGKTWAKAVVICTEMSLELYRQHYLSRRSFLQLSTNSVSFLLRCCFIPELLPVLCAEDGLVEMLFNLMVTLQFDNPICKEICRVFTKMFTVMEAPTGFWNAYKEFFDGRDSSGNYL